MESYIIRIYRHNSKQPEGLVGTVEGINNESPVGFSDLNGLWQALCYLRTDQFEAIELSDEQDKTDKCKN